MFAMTKNNYKKTSLVALLSLPLLIGMGFVPHAFAGVECFEDDPEPTVSPSFIAATLSPGESFDVEKTIDPDGNECFNPVELPDVFFHCTADGFANLELGVSWNNNEPENPISETIGARDSAEPGFYECEIEFVVTYEENFNGVEDVDFSAFQTIEITVEIERTPDSVCNELTDGTLPNGIGVLGLDSTLVKCFDAENPCFADGIPVKDDEPNQCSFAVFGANSYGDSIIISDAIPAEWEIVTFDPLEDNCDYDQANKGKKADKSATLIECVGELGEYIGFSTLVQTRESPGKGHQETTYKPTSCGDLYLNEGAVMLLGDEDGEPILEEVEDGVFEPIVLAQTGPLILEAVAEVCEPELG